MKQFTIEKEASLEGIGLHTGGHSKLILSPAPENTGIIFVRTDLEGDPQVPANIDSIKEDDAQSLRGTNLEKDGVSIYTVEHVMAALAGMQIDNCFVKISNSEPPIMDGSAKAFVELIKKAGRKEQDEVRKYLHIKESMTFKKEDQGTEIVVLPSNDFRITVMVDYQNPALGSQHTGMFDLVDEFEKEFASARTFCFLNEIKYLHGQGLIKGGGLDNALCIVDENLQQKELDELKDILNIEENVFIGDNGIINNIELRYHNEPARHKALDLLGDLYLLGASIKGHILAARPGHQSNIGITKMLRKALKDQEIKEKYGPGAKDAVFDVNSIKKILPHRYPMLLVDKITEYVAGKKIVGIKNVTANESIFQGHFPEKPVFPGVLITEAMAQTGGIMFLNMIDDPDNKLVFFMSMNNVKFRKPVIPGDQMVMHIEMIRQRKNTCHIKGTTYVDGEIVCEGEFMAAIVDKEG
jgi:UDP-3-O-[3-hydroxymyristoyl] N-acetylglucosamine deacetylase/3-hydroxyacyl-[acyl-carrier-protein] dehydratase